MRPRPGFPALLLLPLLLSVVPAFGQQCGFNSYLEPKSDFGPSPWTWEFCVPTDGKWNISQQKANDAAARSFVASALKIADGVYEEFRAGYRLSRPVAMNLQIHWGAIGRAEALASTDTTSGTINVFAGLPPFFPEGAPLPEAGGIEDYEIFAHEFAHLLQIGGWGGTVNDRRAAWIREGSAEAFAWAMFPYSAHIYRSQEYDLPLHRPSQDAEAEVRDHLARLEGYAASPVVYAEEYSEKSATVGRAGYRRAHFFYKAALDMSPGAHGFLDKAFSEPLDLANEGLDWLDRHIRAHGRDGLFGYYPEFIARHVTSPDQFTRRSGDAPPFEFRPGFPADTATLEGQVDIVAAYPRKIGLAFPTGPWPASPKPRNQIYLFQQAFEGAMTATDPKTLVVDADVTAKTAAWSRAVWAHPDAGRIEVFDRVVNVAKEARDTSPTSFKVRMSLKPVRWDLPDCIVVGEPFVVAVDEAAGNASATEVADQFRRGNLEWRAKGADLTDPVRGEFIIAAPGEVTIEVLVRHGDGPKDTHAVRIAKLKAEGQDCMILTAFSEAPIRHVYSRKRDYSEITTEEGERAYIGVNRVAVFDPSDGGWVPIPPQQQAMMSAMINGRFGQLAAPGGPPWARGEEPGFTARMPWVFQRWWNYDEVTDYMEREPSVRAVASYDCAIAEEECRRIRFTHDGRVAVLEYDEYGRLVAMNTVEGSMGFRFGMFEMGRPPGWRDGLATTPPPVAPENADPAPAPAPKPQASAPAGIPGMRPPATAGGAPACDCSCGALMRGAINPACAMQCAPLWSQCVPGK